MGRTYIRKGDKNGGLTWNQIWNCRRNHGRKFLIEREEQGMKNKKLFTTMVVFAMVTGLAGCAKESGNEPDAQLEEELKNYRKERDP